MEKKKVRSGNDAIEQGYFQGLQEEVHRRTGISRPVIIKAIRDNDSSSAKKLEAIRSALAIIAERGNQMTTANEPAADFNVLNMHSLYTYSDYVKWQFVERVELIMGKVFKMSPAPTSGHQTVSINLIFEIVKIFYHKACRVFEAPFDVRLPLPKSPKDSTVVQPDLCIICDENLIDERGCNGAPDLVVEILSWTNQQHDLQRKFEIYELSGVKEYWIVDPSNRLVLVYTLKKGKYIGLRPFTSGTLVESILFSDLKIPVDSIFYRLK